ncbi:prephenate dehydratase [Pontiella sulfatireligans]|uniref:Bifunctional chorismate mutase/prephenate dehydratase n=1 Tax=Pontiella sulfatireligans TaxID=2750658 RepID=A0A6C2UQ90_9BACT|nr:prephenate dehydratase [Pontiella sulfatireligans]VGO21441.1 P-protein [Pontiella sulfatireligans]
MNLDHLRVQIDSLDSEIVRLLNERINVVLEIGEEKKKAGAEVYVPSRERAVFDKIRSLNSGPLPDEAAHAIYREIMSAALALETEMKIAYLGPEATFTHQAARNKFGVSVDYIATSTIGEVFDCVQNRSADYGVVPVENSTEGAVTHTFDQFATTPLKICAEAYLPISLTLLSDQPSNEVNLIFSKQEVFGQCRSWLTANMPNVKLSPVESTTKAVKLALETPGAAAIASVMASDMYDVDVLAENIQDMQGNTTRFLIIGQEYSAPTGCDKTSIVFGVKHKVGALYDALSVFKTDNINMTKIESRPSRNKAWEYYFFVDIDGHVEQPEVKRALDELQEHCTLMTILGSYPKAEI